MIRSLRRLVPLFLCLVCLLSACAREEGEARGGLAGAPVPPPDTQMMSLLDPSSEVRGVYIATAANIDFPSRPDLSAAALRAELDDIIANTAAAGLNAIYFQARPACDALYASDLFPVSRFLTTAGALDFDPLAYLIDAAHHRNILVHAWVNPLRVTTGSPSRPQTDPSALPEGSPARAHPDWTVAYADGRLYLDPGLPAVRDYVAAGVAEIVARYNVDGVLFDDYFYPYPVSDASGKTAAFGDEGSYARYGGGEDRADWRRENVNRLIAACRTAIKAVREDAAFGVAPFGIWQNDDGKNGGSATRGLSSYSAIYCDPLAWVQRGDVDYLAPQIYWRFSTAVAPYGELVRWWNRALDGSGVDLLVSHAASSYDDWTDPAGEITEQVRYARSELTYRGSIFYGYDEIRRNSHTLRDELCELFSVSILYSDPSPTGMGVSVSSPPALSYIDGEATYLIGASSPDKPLLMNGRPVGRTRSGCFSLYVPLTPGENRFVFEQDGASYTHVLYRGAAPTAAAAAEDRGRDTFAVEAVSPASDMLLESGGTVSVRCRAPAGATVTAVLGGQAVRLAQTDNPRAAGAAWTAASYSGTIRLPEAAETEILSLGTLLITAVSGENAATAAGGSVRVRGAEAAVPIRLTADEAELKLGLSTYYYDDFSVQAIGMTDRAVWQGSGMYLLRVGGYVYESDAEELPPATEIPAAALTAVRLETSGDTTRAVFDVDQNVPHNGTVRGGAFELTLYNVDAEHAPREAAWADNPLFTGVEFVLPPKANCVRYRFLLRDTANFYGFDFAYTDGGAAAIFRNPHTPPKGTDAPLAGVRIALDAGHGGTDAGALGALNTPAAAENEKDLNLTVTLAAAEALRALGAEVLLTRETDETVPIGERTARLSAWRPDLAISIHHNSLGYTSDVTRVRGTLGLWWADGGEKLADCLAASVAAALGRPQMTTAQQRLALCRNPRFPSALIEVGFMTNVEEYEWMLHGGAARAGDAVARGVLDYFAAQAAYLDKSR